MMRQRYSKILLTILLLVATGCAQAPPTPTATAIPGPTAAPEPTAVPESTILSTETLPEAESELFYVALGDSMAVCCGKHPYPEYYADFIEQDLGVEVKLLNLATSGDTSDDLLEKLGTGYYRNALGKAQVLTVVISINDLLLCQQGDRACAEESFTTAMDNYRRILEEILAIVSPESAIIRTQTYDSPYVNEWKEAGVFEERKEMMDRWNGEIIEIATEVGIPVARVDLDFNGPDGDQNPGDKGYLAPDGLHPSDAGALRIAELLRGLGYQPLAEE